MAAIINGKDVLMAAKEWVWKNPSAAITIAKQINDCAVPCIHTPEVWHRAGDDKPAYMNKLTFPMLLAGAAVSAALGSSVVFSAAVLTASAVELRSAYDILQKDGTCVIL